MRVLKTIHMRHKPSATGNSRYARRRAECALVGEPEGWQTVTTDDAEHVTCPRCLHIMALTVEQKLRDA